MVINKKDRVLNVPNLRFPGFEGEWEEKALGDVAEIIGGGTPDTTIDEYWNGNIQWFTPSEIKSNYVSKSQRTITELGLNKSSAKILPVGAILITTRATIGEVAIATKACCTNQGFQSLVVNENINNLFISNWIKQNKSELIRRAKGSTFAEISKSEIERMPISLPTITEQNKIASFLSLLDRRIETQSKIIEDLKLLKNELLKKVFIQELRFPEFNENWKIATLSDIGTFFSGGTPSTSIGQYYNGNIPFIKSGEINADYTEQFISEEGLKNSSAKMIEIGDLIYALYGATSGEVGISKIKGAINQAILCIRTKLNSIFLLNYLTFKKDEILRTYLQGGQGNLSAEIIKSLRIPIPNNYAEQIKLSHLFLMFDEKIKLNTNMVTKLKQQKQCLLAKLFI